MDFLYLSLSFQRNLDFKQHDKAVISILIKAIMITFNNEHAVRRKDGKCLVTKILEWYLPEMTFMYAGWNFIFYEVILKASNF